MHTTCSGPVKREFGEYIPMPCSSSLWFPVSICHCHDQRKGKPAAKVQTGHPPVRQSREDLESKYNIQSYLII